MFLAPQPKLANVQPFLFSHRSRIAAVFRVEVNRRPSDLSYTIITPSALLIRLH